MLSINVEILGLEWYFCNNIRIEWSSFCFFVFFTQSRKTGLVKVFLCGFDKYIRIKQNRYHFYIFLFSDGVSCVDVTTKLAEKFLVVIHYIGLSKTENRLKPDDLLWIAQRVWSKHAFFIASRQQGDVTFFIILIWFKQSCFFFIKLQNSCFKRLIILGEGHGRGRGEGSRLIRGSVGNEEAWSVVRGGGLRYYSTFYYHP